MLTMRLCDQADLPYENLRHYTQDPDDFINQLPEKWRRDANRTKHLIQCMLLGLIRYNPTKTDTVESLICLQEEFDFIHNQLPKKQIDQSLHAIADIRTSKQIKFQLLLAEQKWLALEKVAYNFRAVNTGLDVKIPMSTINKCADFMWVVRQCENRLVYKLQSEPSTEQTALTNFQESGFQIVERQVRMKEYLTLVERQGDKYFIVQKPLVPRGFWYNHVLLRNYNIEETPYFNDHFLMAECHGQLQNSTFGAGIEDYIRRITITETETSSTSEKETDSEPSQTRCRTPRRRRKRSKNAQPLEALILKHYEITHHHMDRVFADSIKERLLRSENVCVTFGDLKRILPAMGCRHISTHRERLSPTVVIGPKSAFERIKRKS